MPRAAHSITSVQIEKKMLLKCNEGKLLWQHMNTILVISGLFAKKSFEKGTFVSFYNGIRMSVDDLDDNKKQVSC